MKKKLLFISNMAAPYQVKFCYELQKFFDAEFWFYVYLEANRPYWWKIDLGNKCKILNNVLFKKSRRYFCLDIVERLNNFDPDIILLGGFTLPTNIVAYYWAKFQKKKVLLFCETYRGRYKEGRKPYLRKKGLFTKLVHFLYREIDGILTSSEDASRQFRDEFEFGDKVFTAQYPCDIDNHLTHSLRKERDRYTFLFANRLIEIYNPLLAVEIFAEINHKYPGSKLLINGSGPLLDLCKIKINEMGLVNNVSFLDDIQSWNDLHKIYERCDILLFPAIFSNGNFSIYEAMASGMGIIISNKILGNGRLIENGQNGFVCEPDRDDFMKAVDKYVLNPELLTIHGKINKKIAQNFSIESTAIIFNNFIKKIFN